MDASPNPDAPAEVNRNSVTTNAIDTSVELANNVLTIVKEIGEMLNHVPYVKSLSGVILQIIKIRNVRRVVSRIIVMIHTSVWYLGNRSE